MREWFNRHPWKGCVSEMAPRVRIPLSPQIKVIYKEKIKKLNIYIK